MATTKPDIHPSADIRTSRIGGGTRIGPGVTVLEGARLGCEARIHGYSLIEDDVVVGDRTTIRCGVHLWNGVRLGNDVYIGANVAFGEPGLLLGQDDRIGPGQTVIEDGVSIGAGAIVVAGVTVARGAQIAAGAVVIRSVPPFARVIGNPARIVGYVEDGAGGELGVRTVKLPGVGPTVAAVGVGTATVHRLKRVRDMRGDLSAGEFPGDIPFAPKRYFLVFNVPSEETRGGHAHRACHQFLVCVHGQCAVVVDDGFSRCEVVLNAPDLGVYLPPMTWGTQYKYSEDAVLLVFASDHYDAADYIRNYEEFCRLVVAANGRGK